MINGNELHYISSGMGHTRLTGIREPKTVEWVNSVIKKMNNDLYQTGFLYNAYTERNIGQLIDKFYKDSLCDVHADSGGLQMITRGHTVTEEMKDRIYNHQAKYSTIAMSFDEIPVTSGNGVTDFSNRRFNRHLVEEKAAASGKNLLRQLEVFAKCKTKAKPLLIAQGNCLDTYRTWVDVVQQQIPTELLDMLGGIAMAGASMGNGDLENIRTAFYFTQLNLKFDCKQVHLLGVGSLSRLLPTLVFMRNGLYKNLVISLDSTTHTSQVSLRKFNTENDIIFLGRFYDPISYKKLYEYYKFFDVTFDDPYELFTIMNGPSFKDIPPANTEYIHKYMQSQFGLFAISAKNVLDNAVQFIENKRVHDLMSDKLSAPIKFLEEVQTLEDYIHWERNFAQHMKTNRVPVSDESTLEGLF